MPWKQGYTISDERGMRDGTIAWPHGKKICVSVTVDLSVAGGPEGITAADLKSPAAAFGAHDGLDELLKVLKRHAMRATFAVPAVMAAARPDRIKAVAAEGHEIAAHGFRHEDVSALSRDEEKARMDRATKILTDIAGQRPVGWYSLPRQTDKFAGGTISPNTMDLLIEAGYSYMGNGLADDIPHWWVTDYATKRAILAMPYYYHFDDSFFCMFPKKGTGLEHPDSYFRNCRAEFEAQYRRGRHFHMVLHPQHMGWYHRAEMLDEFLSHLRGFPGVWNPTAAECVAHWVANYPKETHLHLEPEVWQHHEGSLS